MTHGSVHQSLLYRSALISLISTAEWFLAQIIRYYFEKYPDASATSEKLLSLEDLKVLGSIEDAKHHLISLRVDEVAHGSFEDWVRFLKSAMRLSAGYLDGCKGEVTEIFQRRNVMVHNDGIVHSSYIKKVAQTLRGDVKAGDRLSVSREYLSHAIDLIESNFILFAAEFWKAQEPKQNERSDVLIRVAFERLGSERWKVGEALSYFAWHDKGTTERGQVIGQLNFWQALKWQGRFAEVEDDVRKSDFSAKDELYQLARFALLDDESKFFQLLPAVMSSGKLGGHSLCNWPIFRMMRKSEQFERFKKTYPDYFAPQREGGKSDIETVN